MSNGRLSNVAILAIEHERTMSISNEKIIDVFAAAHQNRRIALICYVPVHTIILDMEHFISLTSNVM